MKKYTQKYFKDLVRLGCAVDVTHADAEAIKALALYQAAHRIHLAAVDTADNDNDDRAAI